MKKMITSMAALSLLSVLLLFSCAQKKEEGESHKVVSKLSAKPDTVDTLVQIEEAKPTGTLKIVSRGPSGETKGQVQIKIDFASPLIPLTTLSDTERDEILQHFFLDPDVEGEFRLLGTSAVVFEPTHSLPMATVYKVIVTKELRDIQGNELKDDYTWEFRTPLPQIHISPSNNTHHFRIDQEICISSTVSLDIESLKRKIEFFETESGVPVEYRFFERDQNPKDDQDIGMHNIQYKYILDPRRDLKKDTQYTVRVNPGVMTERGNRPTDREISSTFRTYPLFSFLHTGFCDGCGRKLTTQPYIKFTNQPEHDRLEKYISIEPETEKWSFNRYGCFDYSIGMNDLLLEPNTTYTVTLKQGLIDIYGQEIENPQDVTFTTGDLRPQMWGPRGYQIITPNIEPSLGIKTVNINTAFYKLLSLRPEDVLVRENLDYSLSIKKLISEIKSEESELDIALNEIGVGKYHFDLKPFLKGEQYGVVAYTFRSPTVQCYHKPITFNGLILRTDMGIYTQFHPTTGIIKLNRLTDGQPIPDASIRIYREDDLPRLEKIWDLITDTHIKKITPCFEGVTDADGLLTLSAGETAQCTKRKVQDKILNLLYPPEADPDDILYDQERFGFADPPRLLIIAEKGDDWTFLQTRSGGTPSIWRFGVVADWEADRPLSRGTIFSDQHLYRPGDTVKMKGVSRYLLHGKLLTGEDLEYTIKLRDPHGAWKNIDTVKVNDFGTFHFDIPTKKGQRLGTYQVVAETPYKGLRFYGDFRLAEFRVPEFKVSMDIDKEIALPKEPIDISWEGAYYFGAPMSEATSSLNITRRRTSFRPKGWDDFSFGIPDYLVEKKVALASRYLKETIQMDEKGTGGKRITLLKNDVPYPMIYLCDVEVEDVSKQTISANRTLTVLPDNRLVGLKLSNWIVAKKDTITASIIVSSPEGETLPGVPLKVILMKREYHSVKTETPDGTFRMEHSVVKKEVDWKEVESSTEPVQVSFTPQEAGSFLILAELKKRPDSGTAAAKSLWVAGEDYVPWEEKGDDKLEIIMDKEEYQVGDEATAFIQSPFPVAELFLTVSREQIFLQDTKRIEGSGYTYRFTVTEDMLPNAYVGALLCRLGDPIVPVEEEKGKHMDRIGFAGFRVSVSDKHLNVVVQPDRERIRPGEELRVDIDVTRTDQQGHRSELTVIVVDEGIVSLTGYTPPDLVKVVYQHRGLSARINDNRPFIITEEELLQKGTGYGGGLLEGVGPRIRKEFLKLAYYDPSLITDETGKASFSFHVPDNLTTWRIMVVAVGEENLFGYADEKVVVTQPFILRAVLPRFARIGDQFLSGVAVTNLTEAAGDVDVKAEIAGQSIIIKGAVAEQTGVLIEPGESKAVLFPFVAGGVGESELTFTASFHGTYEGTMISEADALQIPLTIQDLLATETVVAVGETKETHLQKIKIDDTIRTDTGGLNILLSSTALTNIGEGAAYLVNYPYGCLEQTLSRLLALIQLKYLSEKYGFTLKAVKPTDKVIEANIRKILLMQHTDGGFKFWPTHDESNCYLSPYVAYLFKRCGELGYEIPSEVIQNLIGFLDKILRSPYFTFKSWKAKAEYRINILMGLHSLGRKDETYFEEYYNRRNDLSYGAQISLTYLLFQSPSWKKEASVLLEEIKNGMFVTAQTAHFESPRDLPPSWLFMYSPIITTAEAIKLFLEMEPESQYIAKFARYILNARKNGRWRNTYENAKAIDGLVEISLKREAESPDYTANILIAGNEVLKHMFKGYQHVPHETFIPLSELPQGLHDIDISKDGTGFLYYVFSYSYRLKGPQVARHEGFSIKRTVKNAETGKPIVTYEDEPPKAVEIQSGDVLEIELQFSVPQTGYHLVIDDPIPAGLEAIDASLKTTSTRYETPSQEKVSRGYDTAYGYWGHPINHTELRDDRVALFADAVRPGIYEYRYMLRATTSGTYLWPGAKIFLMYEPEQFGSSAEGFVNVLE